jgi:hypothetical protein
MRLLPSCCVALLSLLLTSTPVLAADDALVTHAERSGFIETGRYAEVIALCAAFAERYPQQVRCADFGSTPEGRPMQLLIATATGAFTPAEAQRRELPVTLVQGGIHAGEIDGKDAGFLALRQLLDGEAAERALQQQVLLFVPVFNVDGHERFGAWNRPNQRGPREMGWRTTAQNLNLNRDYAKADAPEMQAMLALVEAWDPLLVVDLHATNGAQFEHDIALMVEPLHVGDEALRAAGLTLRDAVLADLAQQGSLPLPYYPELQTHDEPTSGFAQSVAPPRFSTGYFWLRNRLSMLVETHSWKPYPQRVAATRNTIVSVLQQVAEHGSAWRRLALAADARAGAIAGQPVALEFNTSDDAREITFRGYAYTRTPSEVSGALMTRYDETTPQIWTVPYRDRIVPGRQVIAPRGGYLVPAAYAERVGASLALHGIRWQRLTTALAGPLEAFRASSATFASGSLEGRQRLSIEGDWQQEPRTLAAGALFVPIAQPKAQLVVALLEPQAPDSLAAWGEFNSAFESKEYMEPYVAEQVAREMLARDPALQARFAQRLRDDAAFAASPAARLEFFHRLHPSWDEQLNLYPLLRIDRELR